MSNENAPQDRIEYGPHGPVVKFDATSAALSALQHEYGKLVFDCSNPAQDKLARQARRRCVSLRTALEEARKALKKPLLDAGKALDEKANALKAAIMAVEGPIDAQIGAEEARKEAVKIADQKREFDRVKAIRERIRAIESVRVDALTMTDEKIRAVLDDTYSTIEGWLKLGDFQELEDEAFTAYVNTRDALRSILAQRERDAENERLRALVAEQAEQLAALTPKVEANPLPEMLKLEDEYQAAEKSIDALKAAADELLIATRHASIYLDHNHPYSSEAIHLAKALQTFDKLHAELF